MGCKESMQEFYCSKCKRTIRRGRLGGWARAGSLLLGVITGMIIENLKKDDVKDLFVQFGPVNSQTLLNGLIFAGSDWTLSL